MSYPDDLNKAWQQHLEPRELDAPTVISTFAGCGGSSLGYSMAGFRELLAVEWDNHAVECFKRNFPEVPVFYGDIAKLSVERVLEITGLQPGELDVFDGSPPCQGFSTSGKRDIGDNRNQLFKEYCRLIQGLKPKIFVMENVSGMVKGSMKWYFREILELLESCGYRVKAALINATWYGVPSSRNRMIFIGVRNDLEDQQPWHPEPTCKEAVNVRQAFADMKPQTREYNHPEWLWKMIAMVNKPLDQKQLQKAINSFGYTGGVQGTCLLDWNKPSPTIMKSCSKGIFHPCKTRLVSKAELKRLQSFPDQYNFGDSTYMQVHARIGNSVAPLMMRAIALNIRKNLL